MSMTGLDVFDKTIQTTNIWLNEIGEEIGPDRQRCYHALTAVLHALRDHLPLDESAQLAAQMPLLVRGLYFHQWNPSRQPGRERSREAFLACVQEALDDIRPMGADDACRAVFRTLERHISPGELRDVKQSLPEAVRRLWPAGNGGPAPPLRRGGEDSRRDTGHAG